VNCEEDGILERGSNWTVWQRLRATKVVDRLFVVVKLAVCWSVLLFELEKIPNRLQLIDWVSFVFL